MSVVEEGEGGVALSDCQVPASHDAAVVIHFGEVQSVARGLDDWSILLRFESLGLCSSESLLGHLGGVKGKGGDKEESCDQQPPQ